MSTNIKINKILEMIPEYLKGNDFFNQIFLEAVTPLTSLEMIKQRYGYYFFTPYSLDIDHYFPLNLSFSKKGTLEIDVEKADSTCYENEKIVFKKNKKQVLAVKEQDDSYSISIRSINASARFNSYTVTQNQTFEKRSYDADGELSKIEQRTYAPVLKEVDANSILTWDESLPYNETTTYYLSQDDAIIEERKANDKKKHTYYVTLTDGKIISKQEITSEVYHGLFERYSDKCYDKKAKGRAKAKSKKMN